MVTRILLIHAARDDREMYAEYLAAERFRVTEASTTDEAMPLIAQADAVVTGLLVPGAVEPTQMIADIRMNPLTAAKPIIVVTGCAYSDKLQQARAAGADVVLLKPCLPNELLEHVKRLVRSPLHLRVQPDRRRMPDRRSQWRGGRRDADWIPARLGPLATGAIEQRSCGAGVPPRWAAHFTVLSRRPR